MALSDVQIRTAKPGDKPRKINEVSIDAVAKTLNRFEVHTKFRDFKTFHFQQAIAFKRYLSEQKNS